MKSINLRQLIVPLILSFVLLAIFSGKSLAEEIYNFERMWPNIQQPWFLILRLELPVDVTGNVYVADSGEQPHSEVQPRMVR